MRRAAPRSPTPSGKRGNGALTGGPAPPGEAGGGGRRDSSLVESAEALAHGRWRTVAGAQVPGPAPGRTYLPRQAGCAAALPTPAAGRSGGPPRHPQHGGGRGTPPPSRQPARLSRAPGAI